MSISQYIIDNDLQRVSLNGQELFKFPTDFETIQMDITNDCCLLADSLIRFIDLDLDFEENGLMEDVFFLPSHIEERIINIVYNGNTNNDEQLNQYLPDGHKLEEISNEETIQMEIKNRDRKRRSTSCFKIEKMDRESIIEVVKKLKRQIVALRDHSCAIGTIPDGYGILEASEKERTENPSSRHYDFWKLSSKNGCTFKDVAECFSFID